MAQQSFQFEVAYANLTVSILGFKLFYRVRDYLLAAMVAFSSWYFADGVGHVVSLVVDNNRHPQCGERAYTDLLTPVVVVLLWLSRHERRRLT